MALATKSLWPPFANVTKKEIEIIKDVCGDIGIKKMELDYIHPCQDCFGFGWWPGETIPMYLDEAKNGWDADECPTCGEDNAVFEFLIEREEKKYSVPPTCLISTGPIDDVLSDFEREIKCVESLDIQELNAQQPPW